MSWESEYKPWELNENLWGSEDITAVRLLLLLLLLYMSICTFYNRRNVTLSPVLRRLSRCSKFQDLPPGNIDNIEEGTKKEIGTWAEI